jgi:glycosyltransferase involved in cell wall biosynthesis
MARTKIIIITDAWTPQVNGVVTTYANIVKNLPEDVSVDVIEPSQFNGFNFPFYKGIKISFCTRHKMYNLLNSKTVFYQSQGYEVRYHIATEGPLGLKAKLILDECDKNYTTAYHTKFPEFFKAMYGIPEKFTYWYFSWFHSHSTRVMCSSKSNAVENKNWNTVVLDKGIDDIFLLKKKKHSTHKMLLYVGRVSKEKNIEDFCELDIMNTTKIVVGDGPYRKTLEEKYPNVQFVGYKFGTELVEFYRHSDVLVFPSTVDTYGIVMLEAMACGTPCAGYNVTGPIDQIKNGINGYTDDDLELAVKRCFDLDREVVYDTVKHKNWKNSALQFVKYTTISNPDFFS